MGLFTQWLEGKLPFVRGILQDPPEPVTGSTVGIEIEFFLPKDKIQELELTPPEDKIDPVIDELADLFREIMPGWKLKTDVTADPITPEERTQYVTNLELNSPILPWNQTEDEIEKVSRWLERLGAYMNSNCGIHFHVSLWSPFTVPPPWFIYNLFSMMDEKAILSQYPERYKEPGSMGYEFAGPGRGSMADMMKTDFRKDLDQIDTQAFMGSFSKNRGINVSKLRELGTVEFRYFGKRKTGPLQLADLLVPLRYVKNVVHQAATKAAKLGKRTYGGQMPPKRAGSEVLAELEPEEVLRIYGRGHSGLQAMISEPRTNEERKIRDIVANAALKMGESTGLVSVLLRSYLLAKPGALTDLDKARIYGLVVRGFEEVPLGERIKIADHYLQHQWILDAFNSMVAKGTRVPHWVDALLKKHNV